MTLFTHDMRLLAIPGVYFTVRHTNHHRFPGGMGTSAPNSDRKKPPRAARTTVGSSTSPGHGLGSIQVVGMAVEGVADITYLSKTEFLTKTARQRRPCLASAQRCRQWIGAARRCRLCTNCAPPPPRDHCRMTAATADGRGATDGSELCLNGAGLGLRLLSTLKGTVNGGGCSKEARFEASGKHAQSAVRVCLEMGSPTLLAAIDNSSDWAALCLPSTWPAKSSDEIERDCSNN